ncbi:hypothetical protein PINS_up010011 [Pythium insidiosum]|nr:hypothetical protein PINS_up010011 [Pythium insidiosum]
MADHGQQQDEVVALRALARSLKDQVEAMQARDVKRPTVVRRLPCATDSPEPQDDSDGDGDGDSFILLASASPSTSARSSAAHRRHLPRGHEFFQLDIEMDELRSENDALRRQLRDMQRDRDRLRNEMAGRVPRYEMEIVRLTATLQSVASQLRDERAQNDAMRQELAHYQAQSRLPVRCFKSAELSRSDTDTVHKEPTTPRRRLSTKNRMSAAASDTSSTLSSQLHDDLDALGRELRLLHLSLDAPDSVEHE